MDKMTNMNMWIYILIAVFIIFFIIQSHRSMVNSNDSQIMTDMIVLYMLYIGFYNTDDNEVREDIVNKIYFLRPRIIRFGKERLKALGRKMRPYMYNTLYTIGEKRKLEQTFSEQQMDELIKFIWNVPMSIEKEIEQKSENKIQEVKPIININQPIQFSTPTPIPSKLN